MAVMIVFTVLIHVGDGNCLYSSFAFHIVEDLFSRDHAIASRTMQIVESTRKFLADAMSSDEISRVCISPISFGITFGISHAQGLNFRAITGGNNCEKVFLDVVKFLSRIQYSRANATNDNTQLRTDPLPTINTNDSNTLVVIDSTPTSPRKPDLSDMTLTVVETGSNASPNQPSPRSRSPSPRPAQLPELPIAIPENAISNGNPSTILSELRTVLLNGICFSAESLSFLTVKCY